MKKLLNENILNPTYLCVLTNIVRLIDAPVPLSIRVYRQVACRLAQWPHIICNAPQLYHSPSGQR